MEYNDIKKAIKNKELLMTKVLNIILLNDESVITIWSSNNDVANRYFATLTNPSQTNSYILELYKKKNINRFKRYIPATSYQAAKSFMQAYYIILTK